MTALHSRRVSRRPGARATLRLTLALAALGLAGAGGCTLPPRIEGVSHEGGRLDDADAPFDWPRPVRVGVVGSSFDPNLVLRERVVEALAEGVDRVVRCDLNRSDVRPERVDFVADIDVDVRGSGDATNFLVCFPGFVIFMPSWHPLRYEFEVTTRLRLRPGLADHRSAAARPSASRTLTLTDRFRVRYTPSGYAVGSYLGWGALFFPPLLISPLVTGVVAATDEWDPVHFAHLLAHDPDWGHHYARRVANTIRGMIDEELRFE